MVHKMRYRIVTAILRVIFTVYEFLQFGCRVKKEKLPKEQGRYIVSVVNLTGRNPLSDNIFIANFMFDEWLFEGWEDNVVTYWMELPKNPN